MRLRDYQVKAIEQLRDGVRNGHVSQILCSPTGSGKTVVASHLMKEAREKGSRAVFVVDRIPLVDQASRTFDEFGIDHGCLQSQHWRARPWERIQVASAQTLARRGLADEIQLLVVDEAHTMYDSVKKLMQREGLVTIGLSATPFTKGLGKLFSRVVNVTTTDQLVQEGWLTPLKVFAAKAIDMKGAKTKFDGEWDDQEMETRGLAIIGDIVAEWIGKTNEFFGGPAKTLVFSATVAHGEELCRAFNEQGYNFQQVSYKDGNDDSRRALIEEFRKPDNSITGLVSCEALAKGFDVPDVRIGISARPYRKSLSGHIQQIGRLMRIVEGKEFALLLDHSGNYLRFYADMEEFFANGISELDKSEFDAKVRKEPDEEDKAQLRCKACGYVMPPRATHCPACGMEKPRRRVEVETLPGQLVEVGRKARDEWLADKEHIWREICGLALERKKGDIEAAGKFAFAQYMNLYGTKPRYALRNVEPLPPSDKLRRKVQANLIRFFKSRAAA